MSRTPARFTQADITRVLKAIKKSGLELEIRIEPDGAIRLIPKSVAAQESGPPRWVP